MKRLTSLLLTLMLLCALLPARAGTENTTATDYLGYWKAEKIEIDGTDRIQEFDSHTEIALILHHDGTGEMRGLYDTIAFGQIPGDLSNYQSCCYITWAQKDDGRVRFSIYNVYTAGYILLHLEGNQLVLEHSIYHNGQNVRITFSQGSAPTNASDYLGTWKATRIVWSNIDDITEDVLPYCESVITFSEDHVLLHNAGFRIDPDGFSYSTHIAPSDTLCTWTCLPDGRVQVVGDGLNLTFCPEWDCIVADYGNDFRFFYTRQSTAAPPTAEDYLGYWQVIKVEMDGVDVTADALAFGGQGVTFNEDGALLHGEEIAYTNGEPTSTRTLSTAAWVFQPDGSMEVLQAGHPLTFRYDGEYLRTEDQGIVFTYARAEAPDDSSALFIDSVDCLGRWKLVKLTAEGTEVPDELLATVEFTLTFEADHAIFHMASLVSDGDTASPEAYTYTCAWHVGPSGITVSDNTSGIYFTLQPSGEYLLADVDGNQFVFAREEASVSGESGASDTAAAPAAEESAFLTVFTHPATQTDKELVLASAYAAEKVYDQDEIVAYLTSLGFPAQRIRAYDYDTDLAHSVAIVIASREVTNGDGQTVTLYAIIIRGTVGTAEWISNFEMGNGSVALGFGLATLRVAENFADYISEFPPVSPSGYQVWLTGHSRGAAVANLLAGQYLSLPAEQVYCVTFATPNVARNTSRATNILNFVIDGDVVTNVPFTSWGFDRHGLTVHYEESTLLDIELIPTEDMQLLLDFLGSVSQAEYYEMTLELLHSDAIAARNDLTLPDMLALNIAGVASTFLDGADETTLTLTGLVGDVLVNTFFQRELQLLLGDAMPNENRATFFALYGVIDGLLAKVGPSHAMSTYRQWIECIYYGLPTLGDDASAGGS